MDNNLKSQKTKKTVLIICVIAIALILLVGICIYGLVLIFGINSKPKVYDDISKYTSYLGGKDGDDEIYKYGMDETIWPSKILSTMKVKDYKMVINNSFETEYLGYLVVEYTEKEYNKEIARLKEYESTNYIGKFGVKEGPQGYEVIAMNTGEYDEGFVYALTDETNTVIYVELIFPNYLMDTEYEKYIPSKYLLQGLDLSKENEYREKLLNE